MNHLTITGVPPHDGRYEFDMERDFTTREWGWIKRHAGYLPLNIEEGFDGGDPELFAVFAAIMLRRAGKVEAKEVPAVFERIADAPFGSAIAIEADPELEAVEGDAGPPPRSSEPSTSSSGADSRTSSDNPEKTRNGTGDPSSATSPSESPTLVN